MTERKRLSSAATLILMTRPPLFEHSSVDEFKRWKGAFDELVAVHDGLVGETVQLRELLGDARDLLQHCLDASERGHQYDSGELGLMVHGINQELGEPNEDAGLGEAGG